MKSVLQLIIFTKLVIPFLSRSVNASEKEYVHMHLSALVVIQHDKTIWRWNGNNSQFECVTQENLNLEKALEVRQLHPFSSTNSMVTSPFIKPPNGSTWCYFFSTITKNGFWLKIKEGDL